jgi:hypothetical protein
LRALSWPRRFPPPWSVDEENDACFIVRDHNGQALATGLCLFRGRAGGDSPPSISDPLFCFVLQIAV